MAERAQVKSVEALDQFRARLLVYVSQARAALDECGAEVTRVRSWLETDQRNALEKEFRRRERAWHDAQQALFSARLSTLRTQSSVEQLLAHRARGAMEEAELKLRKAKTWSRDFDGQIQPLLKQIEKLHTVLSNDLVKAAAFLQQSVQTLSDYAGIKAPSATPEPFEHVIPPSDTSAEPDKGADS